MLCRIVKRTNGLDETWYQVQYRMCFIWWSFTHRFDCFKSKRFNSYPEAQGFLDRYIRKYDIEQYEKRMRAKVKTEVMPYGQEK